MTATRTTRQVRAIRKDHRTQRAVARDFGVCKSTIGNIRRNEFWKGVGDSIDPEPISHRNRCLSVTGERNPAAKLTPTQVLAIRADKRRNWVVGAAYGVSGVMVSRIKLLKAWRHL